MAYLLTRRDILLEVSDDYQDYIRHFGAGVGALELQCVMPFLPTSGKTPLDTVYFIKNVRTSTYQPYTLNVGNRRYYSDIIKVFETEAEAVAWELSK